MAYTIAQYTRSCPDHPDKKPVITTVSAGRVLIRPIGSRRSVPSKATAAILVRRLTVRWARDYTRSFHDEDMDDNTKKKQVHRPLAASAVVLVGTGLVVAGQPAQAVTLAEAAPGAAVAQAPIEQFVR